LPKVINMGVKSMIYQFRNRLGLVAAAALAIGLSLTGAASAQSEGAWTVVQKSGELRCGAGEAPPYVMKDPASGEYTGFFVEMCRGFAKVLEVEPVFVDTSWDNMVAGLQAGKWDLAMSLTATPQRALAITFSAPVSATETTFAYNKDNPKFTDAKSFDDFDVAGVTIAVTSGTAQDKVLTDLIKNATIMRLGATSELQLSLMSRRSDVVFDTSAANDIFATANPDALVVLRPSPALDKRGVSFGLRRDTSAADLQVINLFIQDSIASGRVDALIKQALADVVN
jgi:polar amino acid transport system substrate-binding protein